MNEGYWFKKKKVFFIHTQKKNEEGDALLTFMSLLKLKENYFI